MSTLIKSDNDSVKSFWDDVFPLKDFFGMKFPAWKNSLSVPAVNVTESAEQFAVEMAVPGKSRQDFDVKVENGLLSISSEEKEEKLEEEKSYTRREYNYSSFSRSFSLPENVDENGIKATYQDGVLKVTLPKLEKTVRQNAKSIPIS